MHSLDQFPEKVGEFYLRNKDLRPSFTPEPGRDAEWIYHQSGVPWLRLGIDVPHEEMFREATRWISEMVSQDYKELFDEKPGDDDPHQVGWNTICVHGIGAKHFDRSYMYGYSSEDETPYVWTEVSKACPITTEFLKSLPYENLYRARFTMLAPGGFAAPHIGRKQGAQHSRKINVALNHPEGFHFLLEGQGSIPWKPGTAHLIAADDYYHTVFNQSDEIRIHLITMGKPDFRKMAKMVPESYYSNDPFGYRAVKGENG